jgi:small GTP-binding protein
MLKSKSLILNVLVAGHAQHGKSSLIEAIVGKFPDILDFELSRGTTVSLKVIQFFLREKNILLNLLDSPGHDDFRGGPALGLEFADLLLLVISGKDGFQARSYWLFDAAIKRKIPIVIAATKMDLKLAKVSEIKDELHKLTQNQIPIVKTSAKQGFGINELLNKISLFRKQRVTNENDLKFIILGYDFRKGLGEILNVGITSGNITTHQYLSTIIKVRQIFSLLGKPIDKANEGEIVSILLNIEKKFDLGTIYAQGNFISPRIEGLLAEIHPRKEFYIKIEDGYKFKLALDILENLKKTISSFDFYTELNTINILVQGDLQFEFIKSNLVNLIDFKVVGSKIKGILTINKISRGTHNSANVRIFPRFKKALTITRDGNKETKMCDLLGTSAAYEAFHLDGLHVDILSGKNEDDIAQAIVKAIEKAKVIKIVPHQDVIVKIENYNNIIPLIEKYNVDVLFKPKNDKFFLQIKNERFEEFFNSLMKISHGKAEITLFKFEYDEKVLSIDPGTRHFGLCLIEGGELPSLWYINLKKSINDKKSHNSAKKQIERELNIFLGATKEVISKIFIGNGPGSEFILNFFIEYYQIPNEMETINNLNISNVSDLDKKKNIIKSFNFSPPSIYLIDEYKTTKEAVFHLQKGNLINEVKAKGFVDHAIAALLIAKRGIKGEIIRLKKKPLLQLYDYITENYSGSFSFSSIHNIRTLDDLKSGIYLRIKDKSKLDSNLNNSEIIIFNGFGNGYNLYATRLSGNKIIIKFTGDVKLRHDFFKIFTPLKERN